MLPETHPLIEAVTEPLADNAEYRLATHALLEKTFDADHPDIDETLAQLRKPRSKESFILLGMLPWSIAVVALVLAFFSYAPEIRFVRVLSKFSYFEPWKKPALPDGLTKEERILLGDGKFDLIEQKHQLFLSDPDNPAFYAEYADAWASENDELPPDYFETIARIDPDNAFFLYYAAGFVGSETYEKISSKSAPKAPRMVDGIRLRPLAIPQEYNIKDRAKYDRALELINRASKLKKFETYNNQMYAARARVLPRRTIFELVQSSMYAFDGTTSYMQLLEVAKLLSARAEEVSKSGNKEDFLQVAAQRDALIKGLVKNPNVSLVNELVYRVIASSTSVDFHAAADRLGLTELTEVYRKQRDGMQDEDDQRRIREKSEALRIAPISSYAGLHHTSLSMLDRQVMNPPQISDTDLKPMRIAEHELVGGVGVLAVGLLILPATLIAFLFRYMVPKPIRLVAQRMASSIRFSDWIWVVVSGIALPIMIFLIISRWSPVSGRDWGVTYLLFAFPGVHLGALWLSLLIIPAYVLRRRLMKRLAPFRIPDRFGRFPLFVIAGLFIWAVTAFPIIKYTAISDHFVFFGPPALCLCFLFANALRVIFEKSAARFVQAATALAVLPAYAIAIAALCLTLPLYDAGEKHWFAKETLLFIDPDAPDLGAYEFKVAAQKRKEINAIMGY